MLRLLVLFVIIIGLAPGTWLRSPHDSRATAFAFTATPLATKDWSAAGLSVKRAWRLDSAHPYFSGFSSLLYLGDRTFLAGSDRGYLFRFQIGPQGPESGTLNQIGENRTGKKRDVDLEAMMANLATGQYWAAYERSNTIARFSALGAEEARVQPAAMRHWDNNSGPEAMARLPDGRVLVIAEQRSSQSGNHEALLFRGDPLEPGEPVAFTVETPDKYRPTDVAVAPNGGALVILRRFDPLARPSLSVKLAIFDPTLIRPGKAWKALSTVSLGPGVPMDNYEGIAIVPRPDGACSVWLISDDNFSITQDTLLLELNWSACSRNLQKNGEEKGAQVAPPAQISSDHSNKRNN
jgi:hypothetical protein